MPAKKENRQQKEAAKKARAKRAAKAAEDKTFGLKNKNKSKKVQKYVESLKKQDPLLRKKQELAKRKAAEKKALEKARKDASKLLTPSLPRQKVPFGVDPKSILCQYFKLGLCTRGKNCKFSHDMSLMKETAKAKDSPMNDKDKEKAEKMDDTMDNWDETKLRTVVAKKEKGEHPTTNKVCKYFIKAVEDGKYGWFWTCPNSDPKNGIECKYKHVLPPGFVLKTKEQKKLEKLAAESKSRLTLEEYIERDRQNLPKENLTPVTQETFAKWKKDHKKKLVNKKVNNIKKAALTGREIVLRKFQERFFREEEERAAEQGTAVDMSEFRKAIEAIEEKELNGRSVKDYGDGSNAFLAANS